MPSNVQNSVTKRLAELKLILENLPLTLPDPGPFSERFPFLNYQVPPDSEDLAEIGSIPGVINCALEVAFGWDARSKGDGILPILERGPGVCSLVDVLKLYQSSCDNPESDAILTKWVDDIRAGAEKAYKLAGISVGVNISEFALKLTFTSAVPTPI